MFAPNGLARAAVRFRPSAFAGTFVALLFTAAIVSACGIMLETGLRISLPAQRYAGAPVVVAPDPLARLTVGSGDESYDSGSQVPGTPRLDRSFVERTAAVPGVASAVGDVSYPVRLDGATLTAQGYGAARFTGVTLTAGRAPGADGVVVGGPGALPRPGERITLETPAGPRALTVSGRTDTPGAWLADPTAVALSGHPEQVDAIAVQPAPGTTAAQLKKQLAAVYGKGDGAPRVLTGDARRTAEDASIADAREVLEGIGASFGGVATLVAVFTASATVALSVGLRRREFALLRAIGATPRQIRRSIATEAMLVAPLAGALGCLPGVALATWWFGQLRDRGAVPGGLELTVSAVPLGIAAGTAVVTALIAGYAAARRPSKIAPGQALADASVERLGFGWIRTPLGLGVLAGGVALSSVAARESGENAANAALGVVMLFLLAVAFLGPHLAKGCAALVGLPLRAGGAAASLAAANALANARRMASAITPITLAIAFSSVLVFLHSSTDRATENQQRAGVLADFVVTGGDGGVLPADATERAAAVPGVSAAVSLLRTSVLVPLHSDGPYLSSATAQGVDGSPADLSRVQDLGVREGSLAALAPGTVAVDAMLADSARRGLGEELAYRLPDGTPATARIVAVYERGLGLSQVTLPAAALRAHAPTAYPSELLVRAESGAAGPLGALGAVRDRAGYATAQDLDRELNAWANTTMAAVLGGFAAVAAANTLVMTVLDRRRELRMLQLIGSTRSQVLRMIRWEALLVTGIGIALGTAIALVTLIPMVRGLTGESPHVPPLVYGSFVAGAVLLGLAATGLPARAALPRGPGAVSPRRPAVLRPLRRRGAYD
ncbi:FtsX-like permease family protein [Streptomyces sp. NPDC047315]|uniref:FtsX-like permease family protein n=1 Tax=Streptomyces sp. NPDC047315 TaxID=3155142 RepID=UPI0033FA514E